MNPSVSLLLCLSLAATSVLGVAAPVSAFERQTVDGVPDIPLYWQRRDLGVYIQYDGTTNTSAAGVEAAAAAALAEWENAGGGCTDIVLTPLGPPESTATNLVTPTDRDGDRQNRIVFRAEWPATASPRALALTTIVYNVRTGVILDADIDLNDEGFFWTTAADPVTYNDVQNTLTHELGHLLGFAHVFDPEATMYSDSPEGETEKRSLGPDDIDAVCTVYPAGLPTPGGTAPPTAISRGALTSASTCSASPIAHTSAQPPATLALAALLLLRRRRERDASLT